MALIIKTAGLRSTLQDGGRRGALRHGLTSGGAADLYAWRWSNKLLDNPHDSAAIEIQLGTFRAKATGDMTLAVTGAAIVVKIDDVVVPGWSSFNIRAGQTLTVTTGRYGVFSYLAVAGGWRGRVFCGSRSVVVRESLSGMRELRPEDVVEPEAACNTVCSRRVPTDCLPDYEAPLNLDILPGPQFQAFTESDRLRLLNSSWTISPRSDRMGYRLTGPQCSAIPAGIISEGIGYGAVQIPPDGEPIVLLNDRQTIGGYAKFATVTRIDGSRLAQRGPGTAITWTLSDVATQQSRWLLFERFFRAIRWTETGDLYWPE